jgi:hypothetical protein
MSFIPIVERELLVGARRRATFRVRWWTTLIATGATLICLHVVSTKPLPAGVTNPLFAVLAICAFVVSFLSGVFLSSDSLSAEKRQGTLGFLFLSNLGGVDLVLGKFSALLINAFLAIFALLPVMGVPLLLGGVDLFEFWRVVLALFNMLFISLAAGICISAYGCAQHSVVTRTLVLLLLVGCGLPFVAEIWPGGPWSSIRGGMGWVSPLYPFAYGFENFYLRQPSKFWGTLLLSHLVGWIFLFLATWGVSKQWRDSDINTAAANRDSSLRHTLWALETNRRESGSAHAGHAIETFLGRGVIMRWIVWGCLSAWCVLMFMNWGVANHAMLIYGTAKVLAFFLKILAAVQACRFFSESHSTGVLELLLCTPLRNSDIISAQWRKLRSIFLLPTIVLFLYAMVFLSFAAQPLGVMTTAVGAWVGQPGLKELCWLILRTGADFLAIGWLGMCFALTLKRPILAPALTILLVLIIPAPFAWLDLVADMIFISWGTTRLQKDFRDVLIQRYQQFTSQSAFGFSPATS